MSAAATKTRTGSGVEVRPNSIRIKFVVDGVAHKPTLMVDGEPMAPTPKNIVYAHRLGREIREKIKHGTFIMAEYFPAAGNAGGAPLSLASQLDTWFGSLRRAGSTLDGYASAVTFWKKAACDKLGTKLGDLPLRSLKKSHFLFALATRPEMSGKTVNNYLSVLRGALGLAIDDKLLTEDPTASIAKAAHQTPPPDPFSRDEVELILADMAKHYPEPIVNMVEFWFFTGLRTSELVGLRWANVDLASGAVLVSEGIVRRQKKDSTKTSTARTVRLNARALAALQRQRRHTQLANGLVFQKPQERAPGRTGPAPKSLDWTSENAFAPYWKATLKRLGMRYRRPYNCRHTFATMMLMAGRRAAWCAKQLGHSVRMFLEVYAKWIDGDADDREVEALDEWLTSGGGQRKGGRK